MEQGKGTVETIDPDRGTVTITDRLDVSESDLDLIENIATSGINIAWRCLIGDRYSMPVAGTILHFAASSTFGKPTRGTRSELEKEYTGEASVMPLLLSLPDADCNIRDGNGRTPLSIAAERGGIAMTRALLEAPGVDPNAPAISGRGPLFWPAVRGHVTIVKMLLDKGADPAALDEDGVSPLDKAKESGHEDVLTLLLGG